MIQKIYRSFKFEISNYTDMDIGGIILMSEEYAIYTIVTFDKPENEDPPKIRGYVYFGDRKQSINGLKKKWLQNAEITVVPNCKMFEKSEYFNGEQYEHGDEPIQGKIKKSTIEKFIKLDNRTNMAIKCEKIIDSHKKFRLNYDAFIDESIKLISENSDWQFLLLSFYNDLDSCLMKMVMNGSLTGNDRNNYINYIYNSRHCVFYLNQVNKNFAMSSFDVSKGLITVNGIKIINNYFEMITKSDYKIKKSDDPKMLIYRFFRLFLSYFHEWKKYQPYQSNKRITKQINEFNGLMKNYGIKYDSQMSFFDIYNKIVFEIINNKNDGHIVRMIDFYEKKTTDK